MQELIEQLEKATGPRRELDALIEVELRRLQAYEIGLNDAQRAHWRPVGTNGEVEEGGTRYHSPTYTFSVDVAMNLTEHRWMHLRFERTRKSYGCFLGPIDTNAATPAIALCIAALKMRDAAVKAGNSGEVREDDKR